MSVRLHLLGGFRAYRDDRDLPWVPGQPIRSALLLYLALERQAPRDQLARVFWPDQEIERARHSLSQTLYLLRRALGETAIQQQGEVVGLGEPVQTDVADFQVAVETGNLDGAASLYEGSFLRDVRLSESREFEEWVDRQRARLERLHRRLRRSQIDASVAAVDIPAAIEAARAWVTIEPSEDEAQHRLIELLAMGGHRQDALEQFDSYERLLRADDLEPLDETKALVAELRAGRATAGDQPAIAALAPPPQASPAPEAAVRAASAPRPGTGRPRLAVAAALVAFLLLAGATATWILHGRTQPLDAIPSASSPALGDGNSVAVLPFNNLSGDPGQEYFSDGITEELIHALANVEGLRVPARVSSFAFKGKNADVKTIAAALAVGHILEGGVRRSGRRVRIDAQLVNARTGSVVWSQAYDRDLSDILVVQEEIARAIVNTLTIKLALAREDRLVTGGTRNAAAHDAYMHALADLAVLTPATVSRAAATLQQAVELDPGYARAHSALSFTYLILPGYTPAGAADLRRLHGQARRSARAALRLDSTLGEPHIALAMTERDKRVRRRELDEAVSREPASRWARYLSGLSYNDSGSRRQASGEADRLVAIDPLSPTAHYMAANILNATGDFARGDSVASRGLKLDSLGFEGYAPKWPPFWNRGLARLMLGKYELATADFEAMAQALSSSKRGIREIFTGIAAMRTAALDASARRAVAIAATKRLAGDLEVSPIIRQPFFLAVFYLLLDDRDHMYAVFDRSLSSDNDLDGHMTDAVFDPVRAEPRFKALRERAASTPGIQ